MFDECIIPKNDKWPPNRCPRATVQRQFKKPHVARRATELNMGRKFGSTGGPSACVPCLPSQPPTFDGLVKLGLEFHDKADKKRGDSPETACALFREAIERYQVLSQP